MCKINVELSKNEIVRIITYLTLQYNELEKRALQTQKDLIEEHDPEWKKAINDLLKDYNKEIVEISNLLRIFKKAGV